jgi:hypothetical protein
MTLNHAAGAGRHTLAERGADLYETPPCATEALLSVERLPHRLWEPAAGRGAIVQVMCDRGHAVVTSDITDYGFPLDFVADFLTTTAMPTGCEAILTNPPYQIADQFTRHALDLAPRVYLLLRLAFLESERRTDIIEHRGLRAVHLFRKRLPMMHRHGWTGREASSAMQFAWFCWDRDHRGPPTISRLSTQPNQRGDRAMTKESSKIAKLAAADEAAEKKVETTNTATTGNLATAGAELSITKPSAFNLDKFKSKRAAALANVETLLTALPIHKISDAKDYVRLHHDDINYWSDTLCFVSVPIKGQKKDTLHLIDEDIAMRFLEPARIIRQRLALATKPNDVFFLCQVPTQNIDNTWNESNLEACELAKHRWVQATSRKAEGVESYKVTFTRDRDAFPPPAWPKQPLSEIIGANFPSRIIESEDHPGLLRLIGAKQSMS